MLTSRLPAQSPPVRRRDGWVVASHRAIYGWVLCGGLGACAQAPAPELAVEAEPGLTVPAIAPLPGGVACDTHSQCLTLPVGEKPCGGPQRWLAWSSKGISEADLRRLLAGQMGGTVHAPRRPGERSICAVVPDPGAQCLAGRCVLLQGQSSLR